MICIYLIYFKLKPYFSKNIKAKKSRKKNAKSKISSEFYKQAQSGSKVIELQLSMKFILLINVKMPTIVGILTFISRINTTSECFKQRKKMLFFNYFYFFEQLKFCAHLS